MDSVALEVGVEERWEHWEAGIHSPSHVDGMLDKQTSMAANWIEEGSDANHPIVLSIEVLA